MLNSRSVPQCKEAAPIRIINRTERITLTPHAAGSPGSAMAEAICGLQPRAQQTSRSSPGLNSIKYKVREYKV